MNDRIAESMARAAHRADLRRAIVGGIAVLGLMVLVLRLAGATR